MYKTKLTSILIALMLIMTTAIPAFATHGDWHPDRNVIIICSHQDGSNFPPYASSATRTYDDAWGGVWTLFNDNMGNDDCHVSEVYYAGTFSFSQRTLSGWKTNGGACTTITNGFGYYTHATKSFTIGFAGLEGVVRCTYSNSKI
jgi:hypothetical protein